jgi:hypothetical protein
MEILSRYLRGGPEQNHGYLTKDSRCSGRDWNRRITSVRIDCLRIMILTCDLSNTKHLTATFGLVSLGDHICFLVVRVPSYRSRGPGFDFWRYHIFWEVVAPERGPVSLVRITEELLEWKSSGSGPRKSRLTAVGIRCTDHATLSIRKSGHQLRWHAAIARSI